MDCSGVGGDLDWLDGGRGSLSLSLDARVSVSDNQTGNNGKEKKGQQQKIKIN